VERLKKLLPTITFEGRQEEDCGETVFSKIGLKAQSEVIAKISSYKAEQNWQGELEFIEKALKGENSINRNNRHLWYERAVALDMLERPSEAIEILSALNEKFPLHHLYQHSMSVTVQNLTLKAVKLFDNDRGNRNLVRYVNRILQVSYCPWALMEIYLDHLCLTGEDAKATEIICNYLELSPFDSTFLQKALEMAGKLEDSELLQYALKRTVLGLSQNPCNLELKELVETYFSTNDQRAS